MIRNSANFRPRRRDAGMDVLICLALLRNAGRRATLEHSLSRLRLRRARLRLQILSGRRRRRPKRR